MKDLKEVVTNFSGWVNLLADEALKTKELTTSKEVTNDDKR
jgi:hypothetical protein